MTNNHGGRRNRQGNLDNIVSDLQVNPSWYGNMYACTQINAEMSMAGLSGKFRDVNYNDNADTTAYLKEADAKLSALDMQAAAKFVRGEWLTAEEMEIREDIQWLDDVPFTDASPIPSQAEADWYAEVMGQIADAEDERRTMQDALN